MINQSVIDPAIDACARYAGYGWPPLDLRTARFLSRRQYDAAERFLDDAIDAGAPELACSPFAALARHIPRGDFNMRRLEVQAIGARCVADALDVLDDRGRTAVLSAVIRCEHARDVAAKLALRAALDRLAQHYDARPVDDEAASWLDLLRAARAPLLDRLAPTPYRRGESADEWIARLSSNPLGLQALHLLFAERLQLAAHHLANGDAVITEDFWVFVQRIAIDLYGAQ